MKKFSTAKILSLVFVCVMLLGALALTAFATEGETVQFVSANVYYGDTYQIMVAVDAPEGAIVKATDSKGNEIEVAPIDAEGTPYQAYILTKGVAAQAIDEVITFSVEYNGKKQSINYSILQYVYTHTAKLMGEEQTADVVAEIDMLNAFLAYAVKADAFLNGASEYTFDAYKYVKATGVTVNGVIPSGMYAPGSTPFANIDAIEYDADKYELACTINGVSATIDEVKAIVVGENDVLVTVEVVEKAHQHSYTSNVTNPTCTADGYTTFTCECGDSYTEAGATATGHKDENGDFKCDACSEKVLPEDGESLTIAQAIAMGKLFAKNEYTTQKYYLTGIITEVQNATYGNIVISDGENSILIYGLYSYDGETRYDALPYKPQVHDELTVYGVIGFYSAPQMKNGWMDDVVAHECEYDEEVTNPTCTAKGYTTYTCDVCGDSYTGNETEALGHSYVDGVCSVCGVADTHTHNYTPKVTDPTCTADGYTTFTCECGESYTEPGDAATGIHIDDNSDFVCDYDSCDEKMIPAADSVLTIEQAIALGKLHTHNTFTSGKYYVTVTISEVYQTTYGNVRAKAADGTVFTVYGTYSADGSVRYDALSYKPVAGDTITVYGIIGSYNGPQMKNGWITDIAHECDFSVAANCEKGVSCAICGAVQEGSEALGHDFSKATCDTAASCSVCGKINGDPLGHNYVDGVCDRCGAEEPTSGETVLPGNLSFASAANKASADTYMKNNFPEWTISGKLGQTYGGYLGFGRSGDGKSSIKSSAISTSTAFTIKTVLKGNGSSGVATSTLTFTLVDAAGNTIATGYADGSTTAAITPVDQKDTTYNISFTFVEGKTWSDVSNLVVSFAKATGNIGLKSLEFVQ